MDRENEWSKGISHYKSTKKENTIERIFGQL
jgi:hypothetical protein